MRKQYFLPQGIQPKLIAKMYGIIIFAMALSGALFYFIGQKNLTEEYFEAHSIIKTTMEILLPSLIAVNLIALAVVGVVLVLFTHSIAGPLHRLRAVARDIARGIPAAPVTFRKSDAVAELSESINLIMNGLNRRSDELASGLRQLKTVSEKIDRMDAALPADLRALLDELNGITKKVAERAGNKVGEPPARVPGSSE